jgi:hypothetical protein
LTENYRGVIIKRKIIVTGIVERGFAGERIIEAKIISWVSASKKLAPAAALRYPSSEPGTMMDMGME